MEGVKDSDLEVKKNNVSLVTPIAAFHPEIGLVQGDKVPNLSDCYTRKSYSDIQG